MKSRAAWFEDGEKINIFNSFLNRIKMGKLGLHFFKVGVA